MPFGLSAKRFLLPHALATTLFLFLLLLTTPAPARGRKGNAPKSDSQDTNNTSDVQGRRLPIEIRGLRSMSTREAFALLGDRLAILKTRAPSPSLADDAAFILRLLLEQHGYSEAEVTPSLSGGKIILDVKEGRHLWLGSVRIKGVPEEDAIRLSRLFSSVCEKRKLPGEKNPPFREDDVKPGISLVLTDFRARGYWSAKAEILKRAIDPASGEAKFVIQTHPGPLHAIGPAEFRGDTRGLDKPLRKIATLYLDRPADTASINELRAAVEKLYTTRGYHNVSITMSMDTKAGNKRLVPVFAIKSGIRYKTGALTITGLEKTRPEALKRFGRGMDDIYYNDEEMQRRIDALLATGAFSNIQFETHPRGEFLDATLHPGEGKARGASFYGGFGTYEGPIFGASYYDRNFQGRLWNFTSGFEITGRTLLGSVGIAVPWIDGHGSRASGRFFALSRSNEGYDKFETGFLAEYRRPLAKKMPLTLTAGLSWMNVTTPDNGIPDSYLGDTTYMHALLRARMEIDRRDEPVTPTKGWHAYGIAEAGIAQGDDTTTYFKLEAGAAAYLPIAEAHTLAFGLRAGNIFSSGALLPIDLRYFLGGPDSVRSFPTREMPPRTRYNYPEGGQSYWVGNIEYIHKIAGPLKAVAFFDGGGLSQSSTSFGFDDVHLAAGLGLRLDLPIGPVRFEYGHNLNRSLGEPSGTFHFSIGLAF